MIKVLIADDQAMVRTGFGMIIGAQPDMELVGEAADGVEAVAMARRLRPDVALFDIRMPKMDGLEALTNTRQHAVGANVADVWIRRTPEWLLVRVANDGAVPKAATARERTGYGLVGLAERVRAVGGRITAGPGVDGGWLVDAALPLTQEVGSR